MAPSRSAFAYATVRIVPDIEREEFVNAGVIVFSRERRFLRARTHIDEPALRALRAECDLDAIRSQLDLVEAVADGSVEVAPFATMSESERFHWLTTPRSTLVQPGPVHAGVTDDPAVTFERLYGALVAR